jgi:hypothetical protein
MAEIILIKREKESFLNLSKYLNSTKYRATADTIDRDVHVACIGKENHIR